MKLNQLSIKNFRGYRKRTSIDFDDLTAIIGKNDIGKSTILEALSIFFEDGTIKVESDDLNVDTKREGENIFEIECVFTDLPKNITVDSSSKTTLEDEFLSYLEDGIEKLCVIKKFDGTKKTPKASTYLKSNYYPQKDGVNDLHTLKITALKKRAKELKVDISDVDKRTSPEIRKAIWDQSQLSESNFGQSLIDADSDEYGKKIWKSLSYYLPYFALFKSDRASQDGDDEVQNPINFAIGQAVKKVEERLNKIEEEVENEVSDTLDRTAKKLLNLAPSWGKNDLLSPSQAKKINWAKSFKYQLLGNNDIPINKRGSGVRRLILLAFFQAEAERQLQESDSQNVIYAIEEPETSQHPNHQKKLLKSFQELSLNDNTQIIITTHVPGLAELVDSDQIRYIKFDDYGIKRIYASDEILKEVAESLGVLPDPVDKVQVIMHVEGKHDVAFFKRISEILNENGDIELNLNKCDQVVVLPVGGSSLKDFINLRYLKSLNKKEFHLYDSDDDSYAAFVGEVNNRDNSDKAIQTERREIENYIPAKYFEELYKDYRIELDDFDPSDDVPEIVSKNVYEAQNPNKSWDEYRGNKKNYHSRVKSKVNKEILSLLTLEDLEEIGVKDEMKSWFDELELLIDRSLGV